MKKERTETKKESLKVRAKRFWEKNKGPIIFVAGTVGGIGAIVLANIGCKKLAENYKLNYKDEYEPIKLFDKNGKEWHLFKWDSGTEGDPDDIIFFPENEIGFSNEIDWDKL